MVDHKTRLSHAPGQAFAGFGLFPPSPTTLGQYQTICIPTPGNPAFAIVCRCCQSEFNFLQCCSQLLFSKHHALRTSHHALSALKSIVLSHAPRTRRQALRTTHFFPGLPPGRPGKRKTRTTCERQSGIFIGLIDAVAGSEQERGEYQGHEAHELDENVERGA